MSLPCAFSSCSINAEALAASSPLGESTSMAVINSLSASINTSRTWPSYHSWCQPFRASGSSVLIILSPALGWSRSWSTLCATSKASRSRIACRSPAEAINGEFLSNSSAQADDRPQVIDALQQAFLVAEVGGAGPHSIDLGAFLSDAIRVQGLSGLEELVASLGDQPDGRGQGDIGNDMGGIFEPQTVLDQSHQTGLSDQILKDFLIKIDAQPLAKAGQRRGVRQVVAEAEVEEEAISDIDASVFDDGGVGEIIVKLKEFELQEDQRVRWRAGPSRGYNKRAEGTGSVSKSMSDLTRRK